jgi:D-lactate dehydrogenase (cytochrome)
MIGAEAAEGLQSVLGDRLSTARAVCALHGAGESLASAPPPWAVAFPLTTAEVKQIARICHAHRLPMIPWGAGTSLEGHALAPQGGLTVSFARMDRLVSVDAGARLVTVEPGMTRGRLDTLLRDTGLMFPVDPGADATLGGMASTRASGTTAVRYGTMRDNVAGLEVVLADGRLVRTGTRSVKSSSGYDLTALMVGAEGTLGLITGLTLRLHPRPEAVAAATCAFRDVAAAIACVTEAMQMGLDPARIELLDSDTVAAVNAHAGLGLPVTPHLLVEFHGSPADVDDRAALFATLATARGGSAPQRAREGQARARLWRARHDAYPAILRLRPGARAIVTDVCVPIPALARAIDETRADIAAAGLLGPILGHVGDGNFHAILLVDPASEGEIAQARRLADRMARRALRLGGTITGEHGVGFGKLGHMAAEHGEGWQVMGAIKRALDPSGLMNPGKLVPPAG